MSDKPVDIKALEAKFIQPDIKPAVDLADEPVDLHYRDAKVYNLNRLFNAAGESKRPTLDELNALAKARRQKVDFVPGTHTAREVVQAILNRSGISEGPQKRYLEDLFTHAMEDNITNPVEWQNSQSPFVDSASS